MDRFSNEIQREKDNELQREKDKAGTISIPIYVMLLLTVFIVPFLGATLICFLSESQAKLAGLVTSIATFALSMILWQQFDPSFSGYQFTSVLNDWRLCRLSFGVDGLSLYYVLLTTFSFPLFILASWRNVEKEVQGYLVCLLLLEGFLIGVFIVLDVLLFYVFFEAVLIPLFILIGVWGSSENRVRASFLLFLYTLLGSLMMLLGFIVIFIHVGSSDMELISLYKIDFSHQKPLWWVIFVSLAIKTPLLPFHIWLSRAHVEASVSVSMILAGLVLKFTTYAYLRILIPFLPEASSYFSPLVQSICIVTLIYSSLSTIRQTDFKVLVAYSSVAHMSVVVIGLFSNNLQGIEGALLLSLAHGFVSPALFYLLGGVLYDRYHSRVIQYYRGLILSMPIFSLLLFLFILGNMGTPLTLNWMGELMSLMGAFQRNPIVGSIMSLGIVFSGAYSIWLYARLCGGSWSVSLGPTTDLSRRDFMVLLPFLVSMLFFGLWPNVILKDMHFAVSSVLVV